MSKKFIILRWKEQTVSFLFHENRLMQVMAEDENGGLLGNIYIGKIKNIVENIQAAFVEISPGFVCFLPLNATVPLLTSRSCDGRLTIGDEIVVQVEKEALKTKQPGVTAALSLSGKYCVVSLQRPGLSYSSKLSQKAKKRIAEALKDFSPPEAFGIVIRTNAGMLTDFSVLKEEALALAKELSEVASCAKYRSCYSLLYKRTPGYLTKLRDMPAGEYEEIVTDSESIYRDILEYKKNHPSFGIPDVRLYEDAMLPLPKLYSIETRLKEALSKKVWLKSGGYLIIEPTEALTVIDVNSGKVTGKKENEKTYFDINMEAAKETAYQLTLRNISGIIIVDFISMKQQSHKDQLMAYLGDLLKKDAVKTQLVDITVLGLVEITRKKTSRPLAEQLKNLKLI